jgi:hypothetical protein
MNMGNLMESAARQRYLLGTLPSHLQAASQRPPPKPRALGGAGTSQQAPGPRFGTSQAQGKGDVEQGGAPPAVDLRKAAAQTRETHASCWGSLSACLGGTSTVAAAAGKTGKRKLLPSIHTSVSIEPNTVCRTSNGMPILLPISEAHCQPLSMRVQLWLTGL